MKMFSRKGMTVATILVSVFLIVLCFLALLFFLFLGAWKFVSNSVPFVKSPILLETVIVPEYQPLSSDHALFSLLYSTDQKTKKTIHELLAYSVSYGKYNFQVDGVDVDVEETVKEKMVFFYPKKEYFILFPQQQMFLGSSSVSLSHCSNLIGVFECTSGATSTITLPDLKKAEVQLWVE